MTIVGVAADLDQPTRTYRGNQFVFVPWAQRYERGVPLIVTARTTSPATAVGTLLRAILNGPIGQSAVVTSVWFIPAGGEVPRFVTAYPGDGL